MKNIYHVAIIMIVGMLAGCRGSATRNHATLAPMRPPALSHQELALPATVNSLSAPPAACGPGCNSCAKPILPSLSDPLQSLSTSDG